MKCGVSWCIFCTVVAVLGSIKMEADATIPQGNDELLVYPFDVQLHVLSPTYMFLSFKMPFDNEILEFDLASSTNESSCEMRGYCWHENAHKTAILSVCDGIAGVVALGESKYLNILPTIEDDNIIPLKDLSETAHELRLTDSAVIGMVADVKPKQRKRRGPGWGRATLFFHNTSGRLVLLYYMRRGKRIYHARLRINEKVSIISFVTTTWYAYDEKENHMLLNGKHQFFTNLAYKDKEVNIAVTAQKKYTTEMRLKNLPKLKPRYMEVVVVCDASFISFYGNTQTAERYVKSLMASVSRLYRDKTLDVPLNIVLKKIVFEQQRERLAIPRYAKPALSKACKYIFDWKRRNRERFDFGVVLTKQRFGVSGYAPVYRMCIDYKSCTLVSDSGFNSAFIVAHEMAHSVGVLHDGDNNDCSASGKGGNVMAPTIFSTYNKFHWSTCSKMTMRENLKYFSCLSDKPKYYKFDPKELPGSYFDLDEQCRFQMGKGFTACLGRRPAESYCKYLFCRRPSTSTRRGSCIYWSIAPPDGTTCATGKWCVKGRCLPKGNLTPDPVDGGWGEWGQWGACSAECGTGVRLRKRVCDKPKPLFGGKKCPGISQEWRLCDIKLCFVEKLFEDTRTDRCTDNGKGWDWAGNTNILTDVDSLSFNCTFEGRSSCNWEMPSDKRYSFDFNSGKTPTADTGPDYDHTFKNSSGVYLYMESSHPRRRGETVELKSPSILTTGSCLRFYYFMYGTKVNTLKVHARYSKKNFRTLWNMTYDQGNLWKLAEVTLRDKVEFKIVIEATTGNNYLSDIAIDDITVTKGACKAERPNPCNITCIDPEEKNIRYNNTVKDGQKCYADREDRCVSGICQTIGCDEKKGSKLVNDRCLVCGGDGSSCTPVNSTLRVSPKKAQQKLFTVPAGSTHVRITKSGSMIGIIGVKNGKRLYYYTEIPVDYPWHFFKVGDGTFYYLLKNDKTQVIYSTGPTSENVEIQLVFRDHKYKKSLTTDVDVSFYAPSSPASDVYIWRVASLTNCSAVCGGGNQSTIYECINLKDNKVVNSSSCYAENATPLSTTTPCNTRKCNVGYSYEMTKWGKCAPCNVKGSQHRNITSCIETIEGGSPKKVDLSFCSKLVKPLIFSSCYIPCPYVKRKCRERSRRCPLMLKKGYCKYRSIQSLCCKTCAPFASNSSTSEVA